jgi:hypothetical protein
VSGFLKEFFASQIKQADVFDSGVVWQTRIFAERQIKALEIYHWRRLMITEVELEFLICWCSAAVILWRQSPLGPITLLGRIRILKNPIINMRCPKSWVCMASHPASSTATCKQTHKYSFTLSWELPIRYERAFRRLIHNQRDRISCRAGTACQIRWGEKKNNVASHASYCWVHVGIEPNGTQTNILKYSYPSACV